MNRIWNVVRMQFVNRQTFFWVPLIVLAGALLVTLAIYAIIRSVASPDQMYGGGAQAPLWPFAIAGAQALTMTFPFSQAMSVTRREFYLGTLLTAVITATMLGIVFILGGLLEQATQGWGMNGYFFYLPWIWESGPLGAGLFFFALAMLFFVVCFWAATVYKRWGTAVLMLFLVGIALLLVAAAWIITRVEAWGRVFEWFAVQGSVSLALWQLLVISALAGFSYLTLRRAVV